MNTEILNIALLQPDIVWQDAGKNRANYISLLQELTFKPDLIVLPEMFSTGFCTNPHFIAEDMSGKTVRWMKQTAISMQAAIAGSLIIREEDHFFNRLVFSDQYGKVSWYDKRHLFRMGGEEANFTSGAKSLVVQIGEWRINFQICYDLRFPVWSRNRRNYDLLVYASNWPASRSNIWNILLRARAIENQCYVAGVNRIGTDGNGIAYKGESLIIGPKGRVIAGVNSAKQCIIQGSISLDELNSFRSKFPVWKDQDDFQIIQ